jgi:hypothetical protein
MFWGSFLAGNASISTNGQWQLIGETNVTFFLGTNQQLLISYQLILDALMTAAGDPMPRYVERVLCGQNSRGRF